MGKLAICVALMPLLLAGCIFSPKKSKGPPIDDPTDYPPLTTPQNVLAALVLSYEARDSSEYKLLFDPAYLGVSIDQSNPLEVTTDSLRYGDEARHISALRREATVQSVDVDFGSSWLRLESSYVDDPPGSALINISNPGLTIYLTNGNGWTVDRVPRYEFRFGPDVHAPGDTTWQIISWTEVRN